MSTEAATLVFTERLPAQQGAAPRGARNLNHERAIGEYWLHFAEEQTDVQTPEVGLRTWVCQSPKASGLALSLISLRGLRDLEKIFHKQN